ncbi:MAG: hypothetical protein BEN18_02190 [Epulopiscium sp. Nuni2H_MBin001]|nr:MAG: hypothetical protein BEN18_02190 [Epulopiscium sp. Nuni2H_MBin001]
MNIKEPEVVIIQLIKNIPHKIKVTFYSGLIWGFLFHGYMILNKFTNQDDQNRIVDTLTSSHAISLGRWSLLFYRNLFDKVTMPWVNGLVAIICASIISCLIVSLFKIKNSINCILISGIIVGYPSLVGTMGYMFTVDAYMMAFLTSVIGIYLAVNCKNKWLSSIIAIILIAVAIGTYQLYLFTTITILFILVLLDTLEINNVIVNIKTGLRYIIIIISSYILYEVISRLFLQKYDRGLNSYLDMDTNGIGAVLAEPERLYRPYTQFIDFFLEYDYGTTVSNLLPTIYIGMVIIMLLMIITLIKKNKANSILNITLTMVLILLIPFVTALIYITTTNISDVSFRMVYSLAFVPVLFISILDRFIQLKIDNLTMSSGKNLINWASILMCGIIIFNQYLVDNKAYLLTGIAYEQAYSYWNNMMGRIEQNEEYTINMPIALVGNSFKSPYYKTYNRQFSCAKTTRPTLGGIADLSNIITSWSRYRFPYSYLGVESPIMTNPEGLEYFENPIVQEMPVYPLVGSMKVIDGVMVVKLSDS